MVRLDGSGLRRITPWDLTAGDGDWSPDGKQIVFELDRLLDGRGDAFIVGSDGRGLRNLTFQPPVPRRVGRLLGSDLVARRQESSWSDTDSTSMTVRSRVAWPRSVRTEAGLKAVTDGTDGFEHQPDWGRVQRH